VSDLIVADDQPATGLVPLRHGAWSCKALRLDGDDRLVVRFELADAPDWVQVTVLPASTPIRVFRRLEHCAIKYDGALTTASQSRRQEVGALVLSVGNAVDAMLAASPGATIAEALGGRRASASVTFSRELLRGMLSPEIADGVEIAEGYALSDIFPSSYLQRSQSSELELCIEFRRQSDGRRMLLIVGRRDDSRPAFASTTHFSITYLSLGVADPPGADAVRTLCAFLLQLRDHAGLSVEFPAAGSDLPTALLTAAAPDEPPAPPSSAELNLAINSECGQSCAFCSIKETSPAEDGGDPALLRYKATLESNWRSGVRVLRLNGYDPLTYSRVVDLLRYAREIGYTDVHVFSPCTVLADPDFCDAIVDALPEGRRFNVPLYSMDADAHDAMVGTPGAHARVMRAIANLVERVGGESIWILSVSLRDRLTDMVDVADFAATQGISFHPHLPYPSFESRADRFFQATPRFEQLGEVLAEAQKRGRRIDVNGMVPCVTWRHMRARGVRLRDWLDVPFQQPPVPGTEYRNDKFRHLASEDEHGAFHAATVDCPHAARCVLVDACPASVLRGYVELFGIDELQPVSLRALVEAT